MPEAKEDMSAPSGAQGQIFLSYSRTDNLAFADQLAKGLQTYGAFGVSLDRQSIVGGEVWELRTTQLIQSADTVVFALSPESVKSHFCNWEISVAKQAGKRLLTVVNHEIDDDSVPEALRPINRIYFYSDPKIPGSGFVTGLTALIDALSVDLGWIREHSVIAEAAQRWDANGRDNSDLYSGGRLSRALEWRNARPANAPEVTRLQNVFLDASEAAQRLKDNAARRLLLRVAAAVAAGGIVVVGLLVATVVSANRNANTNGILFSELAQTALDDDQHAAAMRWALGGLHQGGSADSLGVRLAAMRLGEAHRLQPLERIWKNPEKNNPIEDIALSRDGKKIAVVTRAHVQVIDAETFTPTGFSVEIADDHGGDGALVDFAPDGEHLFIFRRSSPNWARIYNLRSMKAVTTLPVESPDNINCAAFSPDGKSVLTSHLGSGAMLWDSRSGELLRAFDEHYAGKTPSEADRINCASFSPDGTIVLTSGNDGAAKAWDVGSGKNVGTYRPGSFVQDATISPDGAHILTASADGLATLFDVSGRNPVTQFIGHKSSIRRARFSPNGQFILTFSMDGTAKLWSLHRALNEPTMFAPTSIDFQDLGLMGPLRMTIKGSEEPLVAALFSSDGERVLTADVGAIRVWVTDRWRPTNIFHIPATQKFEMALDGAWLIAYGSSAPTAVWDIAEGGLKRRKVLPLSDVPRALYIAEDGNIAAAILSKDRIGSIDLRTGKILKQFAAPVSGFSSLAISPDGELIALRPGDRDLTVFSTRSGNVLRRTKVPAGYNAFLHFIDANTILYVTSNGQFFKWRLDENFPAAPLLTTKEEWSSIAVSRNAERVATGDASGRVRLWDVSSGRAISSAAHLNNVVSVRFSPDDQSVITASLDSTSKVIDVLTGQVQSTLLHDEEVQRAFWSDRGLSVLTDGQTGLLRKWNFSPLFEGTIQQRIQKACDALQKLGIKQFRESEMARPILRGRPAQDNDPCTHKGPSTVGWWLGQ